MKRATQLCGLLALTALGCTVVWGQEIDDWLRKAPAASAPASRQATPSQPASAETRPAATQPQAPSREGALPGAIELSDGKVLAGYMYTTSEKDWELYTPSDKNIHLIPFIAVLSITTKVDEEKNELEWRWKQMGVPERIYTGRSYPTRRMTWVFHLIDGTTLAGTIKGQPIWIERDGRKTGPMVLFERSKGEVGQKLGDLVYVKRIVVSRRMMDKLVGQAFRLSTRSS